MRPFTYEVVTDAASAVALASVRASAHVTASVQYKGGGTTLIDLMKLDVMRPSTLVDITTIRDEAMHKIVHTNSELRIGSLVSMAQLHDDASVIRDYPILTESLWQAASSSCETWLAWVATCFSAHAAPTFATQAMTNATSGRQVPGVRH
jgi:xanthine dehydrogenase YagS FAD-binding subunit